MIETRRLKNVVIFIQIIYTTQTRHGYSRVANLVKIESFHSYKQVNFRNRIVDYNNPINKPFRNVM